MVCKINYILMCSEDVLPFQYTVVMTRLTDAGETDMLDCLANLIRQIAL